MYHIRNQIVIKTNKTLCPWHLSNVFNVRWSRLTGSKVNIIIFTVSDTFHHFYSRLFWLCQMFLETILFILHYKLKFVLFIQYFQYLLARCFFKIFFERNSPTFQYLFIQFIQYDYILGGFFFQTSLPDRNLLFLVLVKSKSTSLWYFHTFPFTTTTTWLVVVCGLRISGKKVLFQLISYQLDNSFVIFCSIKMLAGTFQLIQICSSFRIVSSFLHFLNNLTLLNLLSTHWLSLPTLFIQYI